MRYLCALFLIFLVVPAYAIERISIDAPTQLQQNSITSTSINDVTQLLKQACKCEVGYNLKDAEIRLILPLIDTIKASQPNRFSKGKTYPYTQYPDHDYTWEGFGEQGKNILRLKTTSFQGVSFGLYGLLQEQLGFAFFHPRQMIVPDLKQWPLPHSINMDSKARFDKKGFHLHTMHPLELTEQVLDGQKPGALDDVKEYINWLVRNGQNYFEFNLLESIDRKRWPAHAKAMVDYGHSRGILMGIDLSLHMTQQKAFMLYQNAPASFKSKEKQIDQNLKWLFTARWDLINMEFSTTEFSNNGMAEKERLRLYIINQLKEKYPYCHLFGREHVVKKDAMIQGGENGFQWDSATGTLDKERGIMIHSVMFYSVTDEKAPVYRNQNLHHMLDQLKEEQKVRETWYYPESAYWITFDNSIPMLLLPYLSGRLDDINTMDSLNVPGHITFSSGWEWGYWLIDWSIARWSWSHKVDGVDKAYTPTGFLDDIFHDKKVASYFKLNHDLQKTHFKDSVLMRYMAAATVTDEMPGKLNLEFQPRPRWKHRWLRKEADLLSIDTVMREGVKALRKFADYAQEIDNLHNNDSSSLNVQPYVASLSPLQQSLYKELRDGLQITTLRGIHRSYTIEALLTKRKAELGAGEKKDAKVMLDKAEEMRSKGMEIVKVRENNYRYPVIFLGRRYPSHTAYKHGYLFTVSYLHFWEREELQVRKDRYGPFFRNIYNIPRMIGVVN